MRRFFEKFLNLKNDKRGVTLVELIITIGIMAVLTGVVAGNIIPYLERAREKKDKQRLSSMFEEFCSQVENRGIVDIYNSLSKYTSWGTDSSGAVVNKGNLGYALTGHDFTGTDYIDCMKVANGNLSLLRIHSYDETDRIFYCVNTQISDTDKKTLFESTDDSSKYDSDYLQPDDSAYCNEFTEEGGFFYEIVKAGRMDPEAFLTGSGSTKSYNCYSGWGYCGEVESPFESKAMSSARGVSNNNSLDIQIMYHTKNPAAGITYNYNTGTRGALKDRCVMYLNYHHSLDTTATMDKNLYASKLPGFAFDAFFCDNDM